MKPHNEQSLALENAKLKIQLKDAQSKIDDLYIKSKRLDAITDILEKSYADDSEDDLCTIGEKICSFFGYI